MSSLVFPPAPTSHTQQAWSKWAEAAGQILPAVLQVPVRAISHVLAMSDRSDATMLLRTIAKDMTIGQMLNLGAESEFTRTRFSVAKREIAKAITKDAEGLVARQGGLWLGMTPTEIVLWLRGHKLDSLAHMRVSQLPITSSRFRSDSWSGRRELPLVEYLSLPPASDARHYGPTHIELVEVAEFVGAVPAELALQPDRSHVALPEDPQLASLVSRLRVWRHELARELGVRPPWDRKVEVAVTLEPPGITWSSSTGVACVGGHGRASATVDLDRWVVRCACRDTSCAATVAALDAVDELLCGPLTGATEALVDTLRTPAWRRALGHLDKVLDTDDAQPSRDVLGFRFRDSQNSPGVLFDIRTTRVAEDGKAKLIPLDEAVSLAHTPKEREAIEQIRQLDWERAMAAMSGHPRVIYGDGSSAKSWTRFDVGVETLTLSLRPRDDGGVELAPRLGRVEITPAELVTRLATPASTTSSPTMWVNHAAHRVHVWQPDASTRAMVQWMASRTTTFPTEAVPEILRRLPSLARTVSLDVDTVFCGAALAADSAPILRLAEIEDGFTLSLRVRPLPEAVPVRPGEGSVMCLVEREGERVHAMRDLEDELARAHAVSHVLGVDATTDDELVFSGPDAVTLLSNLPKLEGVAVEWSGAPRRVHRARLGALRLNVRKMHDWFGVTGSVELDGDRIPLEQLLETLRLGRRFVRLSSGDYAEITDALARRLTEATDGAHQGKHGIEVSEWTAPALMSLADDGVLLDVDESFRLRLDRLHESASITWTPPERVASILRAYQTDGVAWLLRTAHWSEGAVLADDMGLGKTLQALLLLEQRAADGPALVIAPTSVGFSWIREAQRFAPSLRIVLARDENRAAVRGDVGPYDVLVTSYTLLLRDVEALSARTWHTLVLDEAHALKNASSQRAQAATALKSDFTLALTGTPVENRPDELWSLFRRITPGLLGGADRFRERFGDGSADTNAALSRLVRPFILRRKKSEVATDLPSRTEVQVDIDLSAPERALYEEMRKAAVALSRDDAGLPAGTRQLKVLAAITRLRQAALHPRLVDGTSAQSSSKLTRLVEMLRELREEGEKVLVFSQFTSLLALLYPLLAEAGFSVLTLDGSTPETERRRRVDAFQRGEADVFVLSLKAGGVGLNLTAASTVIHLDPWWNPAVEDQATDRAHRIGQTKPVTVYRLVARGTIEEAILALHGEKRTMVAQMLDGTGATAALRTADLLALLSGTDGPGDLDARDVADADAVIAASLMSSLATPGAGNVTAATASTEAPPQAAPLLEVPPPAAPRAPVPGAMRAPPARVSAHDAARRVRDLQSEVTAWFDAEASRQQFAASSAAAYASCARRILFAVTIPERATGDDIVALVSAWVVARGSTGSAANTLRVTARHMARWWDGRPASA